MNGGYEYTLVLGTAALAVAFTGPGSLSVDAWAGCSLSGAVSPRHYSPASSLVRLDSFSGVAQAPLNCRTTLKEGLNLTTRGLGLLTLSAGVLFVSGTNPRGTAHAQTAEHSSATSSGETAQSKIARAMSAGPADVAKSARIVDADGRGAVVPREGNNGFTCMPEIPE
jgi:hypothetical protein